MEALFEALFSSAAVRILFALFVLVGAKLLLGVLSIFLLLPAYRSCNHCDGETLLVSPNATVRFGNWLVRGRLQRRWCPRCGSEGLVRTSPHRRPPGRPRSPGRVAPAGRR